MFQNTKFIVLLCFQPSEWLPTRSENEADTTLHPWLPWSLGSVSVPGEHVLSIYNLASKRNQASCSLKCLIPLANQKRLVLNRWILHSPGAAFQTPFLCASSYNVSEKAGSVSVTVQRTGNLNQYAIVLCRTEQGTASSSSRVSSQPGQQDYVEYAGQVGGRRASNSWTACTGCDVL